MASILIEHVTKLYASGIPALSDVNLEIADGEQVVVVGPSGCGKSTLLRLIAGLEDLTSGRILIGGRDITDVAPKDRDVAMVFQDYALYPHMTVRQNMAYSLRMRRTPRPEIDARVVRAAEMLGLKPYLDRRPATLSGGQKQRVALGRAIIREPKAFLMDEPLSNLDAKLRSETRAELGRLHDRLRTTTLYVTHDQAEAMTLADRIVVLKAGAVQQVAPPDVTYQSPSNMFVAGFIGSPAMNFFRARLECLEGRYAVLWRDRKLAICPSGTIASDRLQSHIADEVIVGVRPEHFIALRKADDAVGNDAVPGIIRAVENMGSERLIFVEPFAETRTDVNSFGPVVGEEGVSGTHIIIARDFGTSRIHRGDAVALAPDPARIHLFSAQTEQTIL